MPPLYTSGAYLLLASRNVLRGGARSVVALGAVLCGVLLTVLLTAFTGGLSALEIDDVVKAKVGAIQIHRSGYATERENQPLDLDLPSDSEGPLERTIRAVPGVAAVAPRLLLAGLVSNGREATPFIGRGIDPAREYDVLPWARADVEGQPVTPAASHAGVVGGELARALGAAVGGMVILQATTRAGRQNALDLDVAGTLAETGNVLDAKRLIHLPLAFAQELVDMPGRATEYVVRPHDGADIERVAAALRLALGPGYEVETWRALRPDIADLITFQRLLMAIVSGVFLVIVVFGVANTMLMSVLERTREIGTMMALGMRRGRIAALLLLEAVLLAGLGGLGGAAASRLIITAVSYAGGVLVAAPGTVVARYRLVPVVAPGLVPLALVTVLAGALLAALYPAWKATRLRPVEALRSV
jgi:putative ABC transport system permease protein